MSYIEKEIGERLIEKIYKYINNQKKENRKMIKEAKEQGLKSFTIQGNFKKSCGRNKRIGR